MKIQKDNTKVALTQEMKDAEKKRKEDEKKEAMEKIRKQQEWEENHRRLIKQQGQAERNMQRIAEPVGKRQLAYPSVSEQLDMLWHDMDNGIIKIDKRRKNTWYRTIKEVKESTPISETWRDDVEEARLEILNVNHQIANSNIHGV